MHTPLQRRQCIGKVTRTSKLPVCSEGFIFGERQQELENITMLSEFTLDIAEVINAVDARRSPFLAPGATWSLTITLGTASAVGQT